MSPTLLETYRPGVLEKPSEEQGTFLGLSWSLGLKPQASLPSPGCHWVSILGCLGVTEAANHVSVIFICRCFLLKRGKMSAGEITDHFSVTGASISRHLSVLKDADLIRDTREGKFIFY